MQTPVKIGIVGHGHVGGALHEAFKLPSYRWRDQATILVVDPAYNHGITLGALLQAKPEAIFLCLPTPTKNGECDASLVIEFVKHLTAYEGLVIVKSTVTPSVTKQLLALRPATLICPEFVREGQVNDIIYPTVIPVGATNKADFNKYVDLLNQFSRVVVYGINGNSKFEHTTPLAVTYLKHYVNSFLATKVAFTHEFVRAMGKDAEEWSQVQKLVALEGRCGKTHLIAPGKHGWGFGGSCFPKDTAALLNELPSLSILEAAIRANVRLKEDN